MKITVISPDKFIAINGIGLTVAGHKYPEKFEAIQYDTDAKTGSIQREGGADSVTDAAFLVPYVDAWLAERKTTHAARKAQLENKVAEVQRMLQQDELVFQQQVDAASAALKQLGA